jgi:vacuolar-type H+-ATPase subunit I/STV1
MTASGPESRSTDTGPPRHSAEMNPWARGLAVFAAVMMMTVGVLHVIAGLVALFENEFYVAGARYVLQFDVTTWGWIHLLLGILVAVAGYFVVQGAAWARGVGIGLAALSLIANFLFIPYYPVWSILIVALDVAVIWALCVWNRDTV